jgi:hypothetical protein
MFCKTAVGNKFTNGKKSLKFLMLPTSNAYHDCMENQKLRISSLVVEYKAFKQATKALEWTNVSLLRNNTDMFLLFMWPSSAW